MLLRLEKFKLSVCINNHAIQSRASGGPYEDALPYNFIKMQGIDESTEEAELMSNNAIKVYPNPFNQYLTVEGEISQDFNTAIIEIYSISGKLLISKSIQNKYFNEVLDLDTFNTGLYLILIKVDDSVVGSSKIVKE